ncbi:MAG TPA: hypothetical protein VMT42_00595 [candidate division Zixibacteria bacterium]|nr:hypothetical protein [candidate division Zixibacteria bacterium]
MTQPQGTTASASQTGRIVGPSAILTLTVPVVALIATLLSGSLLLLTYVHVLTGGTWTGIDLFMGLVMSRVLKDISTQSRVEIIKKLVPIMLFFMPALASVAITAGVYLAISLGWSFFSTPIIAAFIIVIILSVQGFALILPNEVRVFLELRKPNPDTEKIVRLGMRNFYFAGSQTIFQIAIIFVMAYMGTI